MAHFKCQNCQRNTTELSHFQHCHHDGKNGSCTSQEKFYDHDSEFDHNIDYGKCRKCHAFILAKNERKFAKIDEDRFVKNQEKWSSLSRDKKNNIPPDFIDRCVISFHINSPL
jgi:hypothetical protein